LLPNYHFPESNPVNKSCCRAVIYGIKRAGNPL